MIENYENHYIFHVGFMNWRLYRSITDSNYEIEEFRPAISSLDAHQRECQHLEETEDSQIPLVLEDIDGVFREMVRTPDYFTSSDSHDNIETESEDNSIVALLCEICGELCPSDKLIEHQEKCIREREGV